MAQRCAAILESTAAVNYNIPFLDYGAFRAYGYEGEHLVMDMDGDSKVDLVDLEDDANTTETWLNGSQKYWKVYLQSGAVGIDETTNRDAPVASPNPFTNSLVVSGTAANGELILYDVLGKEVMRQKTTASTTALDVQELHQGVYILNRVEGITAKKIVVVRL
jgi:hypothetical protein